MTFIDLINIAIALATIGLGAVGWLAPRWTMQKLDIRSGPSNMAFTEVSAGSGGLFVGVGIGVLFLNDAMAWVALGFAYTGSAVGRITSILRDDAASRQSWTFFGCEAAFGIWLVLANLIAA